MSVRITAAGAVAISFLAYFTAPVSACDERFIKKCERASAAAAAAAEEPAAPAARRKSAGRVHVVVSRRSRHTRFTKRTRAPGFAIKRDGGMTLASAEVRATTLPPQSALARRFRGFIDPQPIAQNAFEALRKPHMVADSIEPPTAAPAVEAAMPVVAEAPAPVPNVAAKQDRVAPKAATMELASAESRPVTLPDLPPVSKGSGFAAANAAPAPATPPAAAPQTFVSETPPLAPDPQPSRFSVHQLVLALCGALGAASALRFIVGA